MIEIENALSRLHNYITKILGGRAIWNLLAKIKENISKDQILNELHYVQVLFTYICG